VIPNRILAGASRRTERIGRSGLTSSLLESLNPARGGIIEWFSPFSGGNLGNNDSSPQQRSLDADARILRSLTGANINLSPQSQQNEESASNSEKSDEDEEDDLESSQPEDIEYDEILDSQNGDEEEDSFEVESEWSELDCIFNHAENNIST